MNRPAPLALAWLALALGLGALGGGFVGALLASSRPAGGEPVRAAQAPTGSTPAAPDRLDGERVELLLGTVIDELRSLRASLGSGRQSPPQEPPDASELERVVEAVEALTKAVRSQQTARTGGGGPGPLWMPDRAPNPAALLERLTIEDDHERVRPYLLWTYQQVLDRFGPPTFISSLDSWSYEDRVTGEEVYLRFERGFLIDFE